MKKVLQVICCALGSGMIGFFANQLNTVVGSACFALGVALLVVSIVIISKKDNEENWQIPICRWECSRLPRWSHIPLEFETLLRYDKNIFFVASWQEKSRLRKQSAFFNEAHLRCMKNEATFGYEALLRNIKNEKRALRFMATKLPLHRSQWFLLHASAASASLNIPNFPQTPCNPLNFMI